MTLTLRVENLNTLPDGGPLSVSIKGKRGLDIGRDQYLDWTLPDPSRFISGKHCEVRWHDGGYWLHDISANGTFLQGDDNRLKEPHRLRNGDRFAVGHYIVAVELDDDAIAATEASSGQAAASYDELWSPVGEAAPPIDPRELKASGDLRPLKPDFLNWAIDVPPAFPRSETSVPAAVPHWQVLDLNAGSDESWSDGAPKPAPSEPPSSPIPVPRRPLWMSTDAEAHSAASPASAPSPPPAPARGFTARNPPSAASTVDSDGHLDQRDPTARGVPPSGAEFIRLFARGAGLPDDAFAARDPAEFAEQLGQLMFLVLENTRQLLDARQQAKRLTHSSHQTTIEALNNNPLKFAPTIEDAMRIMFGPKTRGYLDARGTLVQSFNDVKRHQVRTYAAMQHAVKLMAEELDPARIEAKSDSDRGLASIISSRKARLWDIYVARWQARTEHQQDGMLAAFMDYFADCYDRGESDVR